jgi:RNA polymerase sigma-70 factor (ECF subfamily)
MTHLAVGYQIPSLLPAHGARLIFPSMASSVDDVLAAGRTAWPNVVLERDTVARYLEAANADGDGVPPEHAADFFLACACAVGVPEATRALDGLLRREVARSIARIDARPEFVEDALQSLQIKLLTGDEPKIATYGGKAPLGKWLATAGARTALNLRRGKDNEPREAITSAFGENVACTPELAYLRDRYREAFEEALCAAVGELTERERVLLRMNLVEHLGVDRLSRVYGCGRSTVARWLAAARAKLLDSVRARLREQLKITDSEIDSIAAAVASHLDVSVARLLDPAG